MKIYTVEEFITTWSEPTDHWDGSTDHYELITITTSKEEALKRIDLEINKKKDDEDFEGFTIREWDLENRSCRFLGHIYPSIMEEWEDYEDDEDYDHGDLSMDFQERVI